MRHNYHFTTSYHTRFPEYVAERIPVPLFLSYAVMRKFHRPAVATMVATDSIAKGLAKRGFRNLKHWTRGVDTTLFQPYPRDFLDLPRPILLCVGRVAVEKNLDAFLSLDVPGTKVVVGDGPQRAALEKAYPQAIFAGTQTGETLARYFSAADVFVFPSRTDTFGLVILEALACGVPVAAYPVPGPEDILAQQAKEMPVGILDEDLASAAQAALSIPRSRCREFALRYSWEEASKQFLYNISRLR